MMQIAQKSFGTTRDGVPVTAYTLRNARGAEVCILDYGATVQAIRIPVAAQMRDVVLGYDTLAEYEEQTCYFGVTIGRVANRIGGASFDLNGETFALTVNERGNCHHGGVPGFAKRVWTRVEDAGALVLRYESPDGESGFPGNLQVQVSYLLTEENALQIEFEAQTDRATPVNLTNHCYFNLNGHNAGDLTGHRLQICAEKATAIDETLLPTGELTDVAGTADDFRQEKELLADAQHTHDLNYVLSMQPYTPLRRVASAQTKDLRMDCLTTQPGLQLYTADQLDAVKGKNGAVYGAFSAFCLEAQNWPDAVHHASFPNSILYPEERYRQTIVYQFCV